MTFMVNGNGKGYPLGDAINEAFWDAIERGHVMDVTGFGGRTIVRVDPRGGFELTPFAVHYFRHACPTGEVCCADACTTDHRDEKVME